ncbi:MAG: cbb3-type cytochrome c oxidase subunit 3 [Chryseolinea sp.]
MYKNVLQSIDHIEVWPIISFIIFFIFFISLLWWVFTVDKNVIKAMSEIPFDSKDQQNTNFKKG